MTHSLSTRAIRLRKAVQALLAVAAVQSSAEFGASTQQADLAQSRHTLTSPASQVQRAAQTLFTVARAHARGHLGHCKQKKKGSKETMWTTAVKPRRIIKFFYFFLMLWTTKQYHNTTYILEPGDHGNEKRKIEEKRTYPQKHMTFELFKDCEYRTQVYSFYSLSISRFEQ